MTNQEEPEPWQIRIRHMYRKLERNTEAFQKLEEIGGSTEDAEKLLKETQRTGRSITHMLRNSPQHLTVNKSDCLTDFERCVKSLTNDNEKTEEKIKGYLACKEQSSQPSVSNNQRNSAREFTSWNATITGGGVAVAVYISSKIAEIWHIPPQFELFITGSASVLIIAGFSIKSEAHRQDEESNILNASPANDTKQLEKKEQTPEKNYPWLKPPGANL